LRNEINSSTMHSVKNNFRVVVFQALLGFCFMTKKILFSLCKQAKITLASKTPVLKRGVSKPGILQSLVPMF